MHAIISPTVLKHTLSALKPAFSNSPLINLEVARGVFRASSSNFSSTIIVEHDASGEGSWQLDPRKLDPFLHSSHPISFEGAPLVAVRSGGMCAKIQSLPALSIPPCEGGVQVGLMKEFLEALRKVGGCCASTGPISGIHVGGGAISATDGRMLASISLSMGFEAILPGEILGLVQALPDGDLHVAMEGGMIVLRSGNVVVKSKLIDGVYPDIGLAMQKNPVGVSGSLFSTKQLISAVRAVSSCWTHKRVGIVVDGESSVRCENDDGEEIIIPVECEAGAPFKAWVNPSYLLPVLGAAGSHVKIGASNNALSVSSPGFFGMVAWLKGSSSG